MMSESGLTNKQLHIIRDILTPYYSCIDKVALFGLRATDTFRDNSDIDMVLFGNIDEKIIDRLRTLFDESDLSVKVDVNSFDLIAYPPLKEHIGKVMKPLFTKNDLKVHN